MYNCNYHKFQNAFLANHLHKLWFRVSTTLILSTGQYIFRLVTWLPLNFDIFSLQKFVLQYCGHKMSVFWYGSLLLLWVYFCKPPRINSKYSLFVVLHNEFCATNMKKLRYHNFKSSLNPFYNQHVCALFVQSVLLREDLFYVWLLQLATKATVATRNLRLKMIGIRIKDWEWEAR